MRTGGREERTYRGGGERVEASWRRGGEGGSERVARGVKAEDIKGKGVEGSEGMMVSISLK